MRRAARNEAADLTGLENSLYGQLDGNGGSGNEQTCDPDSKFRTLDGTCNNLASPRQGAAATAMPRLMDNAYSDGLCLTMTLS